MPRGDGEKFGTRRVLRTRWDDPQMVSKRLAARLKGYDEMVKAGVDQTAYHRPGSQK